MARAREVKRPSTRGPRSRIRRYTVDASVFVNAFNPHEDGHEDSLAILAAIHQAGDPVVVPTLVLPEIASAVSRASGDADGARQFVRATAALPHVTLVALTSVCARQAAELAATHRLRGADSVYVAVAQRYGTTLVSRDEEQRSRASLVVTSLTPAAALRGRQTPRLARRTSPSVRRRG